MSAGGVAEKVERLRRSRETHRAAMWAALSMALGAVIGVVLFGRAPGLVGIVAGAVLVACLGICVWAGIAESRGARAVERALEELHRDRGPVRRRESQAHVRNAETEGGV